MRKFIQKQAMFFIVICIAISMTGIAVNAKSVSKWDGKTYSEPKIKNGVLLINSAEELAWVLQNQDVKNATKIKINADLDMNNKFVKSFPIDVKEFDGNYKVIKNIKTYDSGLFGDSAGIKIFNITFEKIQVISKKNAGLLIGTLTGSSSFENINILGPSIVATTNGHAGGIVGEIRRSSEKNRDENVDIKFSNCSIISVIIGGSHAEGKMVGMVNGYDHGEVVSINDCYVGNNVKLQNFKSTYISENQSCFLEELPIKYNGMIGDSAYYRGLVYFDGKQFLHKWDGKTCVEPLLANKEFDNTDGDGKHQYAVYTPFDLVGVREKTDSPNAIYFKNSIDMNGMGKDHKYNVPSLFTKSKQVSVDDNNFKPFKQIMLLNGENHTIYNLSICEMENSAGAFILSATDKTEHKNITFDNCQTVATHKLVKTNATAQGAILIANAGGNNYKMENINIRNCKVFALQKVGILAGYVRATNSTVNNCTVSDCYVENYMCNISETFDSGNKTFKGRSIRVKASFYPHGEVGGLIGFVQNSSNITNCHVKNTIIDAYGQADKMATISGSRLGKIALLAAGYYQVPGRHVSTFIGDIRTTKSIAISNCSVDTKTKCINTWDKHNSTYSYIGRAYYVEFLDTNTGTVKINNKNLILADCNKHTSQ